MGLFHVPLPVKDWMSTLAAAPRLARAAAAVLAPVPPSATARSVMPVMDPPVMVTEEASCVEIVPTPAFVRIAAASDEVRRSRPVDVVLSPAMEVRSLSRG